MLSFFLCPFCDKMKQLGVQRHNRAKCQAYTCECQCGSLEKVRESLETNATEREQEAEHLLKDCQAQTQSASTEESGTICPWGDGGEIS